MNRAQELIDGLRRRAAACDEMANDRLANDPSWTVDEKVVRCRAKAHAYAHSAELAQQILGTEREPDFGSGFVTIAQELIRTRDELRRAADLHDAKRQRAAARGEFSDANNHDVLAYARQYGANEIDALLERIGLFASTKPERDAEYWRMRCPVTEHDVTEHDVTREQATAWMDANGFEREPAFDDPTWRTGDGGFYGIFSREESHSIAFLCNNAGEQVNKPAQLVLDEMAAVVVETKP